MSEISTHPTQEASPKSRRFSEAFKRDSVRLVTDEQYSFKAAAQAVGVIEKSLRDWHKKFAPPPQPCGDDATVNELRGEVKRLRRELKRAEMEREILKKRQHILRRSRSEVRLDQQASRLVPGGIPVPQVCKQRNVGLFRLSVAKAEHSKGGGVKECGDVRAISNTHPRPYPERTCPKSRQSVCVAMEWCKDTCSHGIFLTSYRA